jgi:hypothetical protein
MPKAFYCEQPVTVGDETLRLVLNFRAIDAIEGLTDRSFNEVLTELQKIDAKLGLVGKVLWGLLREHHPEVTIDQAASLMFGQTGETVGMAIGKLISAALPRGEAKGKNPPKRRGASKPS